MTKKQVIISLFFISVMTLFLPSLWQLPILFALYFIWPNHHTLCLAIPLSYAMVSILTHTWGITTMVNTVCLLCFFYLWRHRSFSIGVQSLCYMALSFMMTSIIPSIVGLCKHTLYIHQFLSYSANLVIHSMMIIFIMTVIILGIHNRKKEASR